MFLLFYKLTHIWFEDGFIEVRVKSGNFRHQVNSDIRLQTVEIEMRRLLMQVLRRKYRHVDVLCIVLQCSLGFSLFA